MTIEAISTDMHTNGFEPLKMETDADHPWAVVFVDGCLRMNPGMPAFRTREAAEGYVDGLQEGDSGWPIDGTIDYEWRPDLDENPNATKARELVEEAEVKGNLDHQTAVENLLAAQVYATLAVRDQIAGYR